MPRRILILGNSGSGKPTYASMLAKRHGLGHVDLDPYAWRATDPPERRPVQESLTELRTVLPEDRWVVCGPTFE